MLHDAHLIKWRLVLAELTAHALLPVLGTSLLLLTAVATGHVTYQRSGALSETPVANLSKSTLRLLSLLLHRLLVEVSLVAIGSSGALTLTTVNLSTLSWTILMLKHAAEAHLFIVRWTSLHEEVVILVGLGLSVLTTGTSRRSQRYKAVTLM